MTRSHGAVAAIAMFLSAGAPATAEQFMLELAAPVTQDDTALRQSLGLHTIEAFQQGDRHYVVIDARDDAAIEAYFAALKLAPVNLRTVRIDWQTLTAHGVARQQGIDMLTEAACGFCAAR